MIAVLAAAIGLPLLETHRPAAIVIVIVGLVVEIARQSRRWTA